ncbi:retroviral-like aspartic protease family protein [Caulobacter segnis]|uniref:retroviral-like aspartic protease family protein n=1 Tax=Caulobacter segnis TaxID=88688 RepID=UPI00240EBE80|nr:retroviral-like aspartic protease family protein [Caulobacter segnis]MDG2523078.1 retroviral-like aspartic protease family protein [Caulobacter segnis]
MIGRNAFGAGPRDVSRRRAMMWGLALSSLAGLGHANTPVAPAPPHGPEFDVGTDEDSADRVTAPVFLNGKGPFPFMIDTGANYSAVSNELAAALSLPDRGPVVLNTIVGPETTGSVEAGEIKVGRKSARNVRMASMPRRWLGAAGLIGMDQLASQRLTLDFANASMKFGGAPAFGDTSAIVVSAQHRSGPLTLVNARVGGALVTAFLDSGADGTVGNPALRQLMATRLRRVAYNDMFVPSPLISPTGQTIPGELAVLRSVSVGGMDISNLPIVFADLHTFRMWDMHEEPAFVLGVDILRRFRSVVIDFRRGEVIFRLPRDGGPAPYTGSRMRRG